MHLLFKYTCQDVRIGASSVRRVLLVAAVGIAMMVSKEWVIADCKVSFIVLFKPLWILFSQLNYTGKEARMSCDIRVDLVAAGLDVTRCVSIQILGYGGL